MKLFHYSMETVLDYRRDLEDVEKQKFADILREYERQKSVLDDYKEKINAAESFQIAKSEHQIYELKNLYQYVRYLKEKMEIQNQLVLETERTMEIKRKQLISVQKDRKIMEKHKEKARDRYYDDANRVEQKSIDELALYSYMRK